MTADSGDRDQVTRPRGADGGIPVIQVDDDDARGEGGGGCSMSVDNQLPPQVPA